MRLRQREKVLAVHPVPPGRWLVYYSSRPNGYWAREVTAVVYFEFRNRDSGVLRRGIKTVHLAANMCQAAGGMPALSTNDDDVLGVYDGATAEEAIAAAYKDPHAEFRIGAIKEGRMHGRRFNAEELINKRVPVYRRPRPPTREQPPQG